MELNEIFSNSRNDLFLRYYCTVYIDMLYRTIRSACAPSGLYNICCFARRALPYADASRPSTLHDRKVSVNKTSLKGRKQ